MNPSKSDSENQKTESKRKPAKRVQIVSLRMVKESSTLYANRQIRSPEDSYNLFKQFLTGLDRERHLILCLDTKNQPTSISTMSVGSLNATIVHPREIFKIAILSNAASIICGHNHPSGCPDPSSEDIKVTTRLQKAGEILGIEVLDHIIVGDDSYVSLKEKGHL